FDRQKRSVERSPSFWRGKTTIARAGLGRSPSGTAFVRLSLLILFRLPQEFERSVQHCLRILVSPRFHQRLKLLHNLGHLRRIAPLILPALHTLLHVLQFPFKYPLNGFRRGKLSRSDFTLYFQQFDLLLGGQPVFDSENQRQMCPLNLTFLVQDSVE